MEPLPLLAKLPRRPNNRPLCQHRVRRRCSSCPAEKVTSISVKVTNFSFCNLFFFFQIQIRTWGGNGESINLKIHKSKNKFESKNGGRMIFACCVCRAGRLTGNGEPFDCVAGRTAHPTAHYQPTLSRIQLLN